MSLGQSLSVARGLQPKFRYTPGDKQMKHIRKIFSVLTTALLAATVGIGDASAQGRGKYGPGASDTEVKVGQTVPFSGPLSSLATVSQTMEAYLKMINEAGGVNGRKITLIALDDAYSPPKALEQTRRLVEQDEVLFMYNQIGTPPSVATQKYLNSKGVPQIFSTSASSKFNDPTGAPWSSSGFVNGVTEGAMFGRYVATKLKTAKVAILYQNDDFGKDYVKGFKSAIAGNGGVQVVRELSYESTDPTIDSQMATLAATGADVFFNVSAGRAASQSITSLANSQWRPVHLMNGPWAEIESVFKPAGVEKAKGIITFGYMKSIADPALANDPGVVEYTTFMQKYRPAADKYNPRNLHGYLYAQVLVHIIREAGNDLTRENINKVALNLRNFKSGVLVPSVSLSTSPTQRFLINSQEMRQFNGEKFVSFH